MSVGGGVCVCVCVSGKKKKREGARRLRTKLKDDIDLQKFLQDCQEVRHKCHTHTHTHTQRDSSPLGPTLHHTEHLIFHAPHLEPGGGGRAGGGMLGC